jgi:hypothetical protein
MCCEYENIVTLVSRNQSLSFLRFTPIIKLNLVGSVGRILIYIWIVHHTPTSAANCTVKNKNSKTSDPNVGVGVSPYKIIITLND